MTQHSDANDLNQQPKSLDQTENNGDRPGMIGRRQVLTTGVATAAMFFAFSKTTAAQEAPPSATVLPGTVDGAGPTSCSVAPTDCAGPTLNPLSDETFTIPQPLYSTAADSTSTETFRTLASNLEIVENPLSSGAYTRRFQIKDTGTPLMPGPTLCVYPGDRIAINVANELSADSSDTYCPKTEFNRPHCFNHTNMHFHGLHVSPLSLDANGNPISGNQNNNQDAVTSSDDVLYTLTPGNNHDYCVQLPEFHGPGTHWYHAHVHGATALDLANGIVGTLIVQEPPGEEILAGAPDVVMVLQETLPPLKVTAGGSAQQRADRAVYETSGNKPIAGGKPGDFFLNGQKVTGGSTPPTLTIQKGEVQRWRMINGTGTPRGFMVLQIVDTATNTAQVVYRVAVDGVTLYGKAMNSPQVQQSSSEFSPGNRVDWLVDLPSGNYQLQKLPPSTGVNASANQGVVTLATITVTEEEYTDPTLKTRFDTLKTGTIPGTVPAYLQSLPDNPPLNPKSIVFQAQGGKPQNSNSVGKGYFKISETQYGDTDQNGNLISKMTVPLGGTEDWILANVSGASHPFHIHVNPFQIVEVGTLAKDDKGNVIFDSNQPVSDTNPTIQWSEQEIPAGDRVWWDTIAVKPGEAMRIRHRFWDYWGTFVLHCHVLIHEDQGMMWDVEVTNTNSKGVNPCQTLAASITDYS